MRCYCSPYASLFYSCTDDGSILDILTSSLSAFWFQSATSHCKRIWLLGILCWFAENRKPSTVFTNAFFPISIFWYFLFIYFFPFDQFLFFFLGFSEWMSLGVTMKCAKTCVIAIIFLLDELNFWLSDVRVYMCARVIDAMKCAKHTNLRNGKML